MNTWIKVSFMKEIEAQTPCAWKNDHIYSIIVFNLVWSWIKSDVFVEITSQWWVEFILTWSLSHVQDSQSKLWIFLDPDQDKVLIKQTFSFIESRQISPGQRWSHWYNYENLIDNMINTHDHTYTHTHSLSYRPLEIGSPCTYNPYSHPRNMHISRWMKHLFNNSGDIWEDYF